MLLKYVQGKREGGVRSRKTKNPPRKYQGGGGIFKKFKENINGILIVGICGGKRR